MNEETKQFLKETRSWAQKGLDKALNFWINNAFDNTYGGIYTCLTREGQIYSTDKSVWMAGQNGMALFVPLPNIRKVGRMDDQGQILY